MSGLDAAIAEVQARDACSGCGLCPQLDGSLRMRLDADGRLRPQREGAPSPIPDAEEVFRRSCPGVVVRAPRPPERAAIDPLLGASLGIWRGWAADDAVRTAGSSGGVLTALHAWLLAEGRVVAIAGAASGAEPRRTVPVTITTREEALAAAGSRYAPVGVLEGDAVRTAGAVTGKPCEIAALRAAAPDLIDGEPPLLLSFFCAGTPSQHATDALLAELGVPLHEPVRSLRYRGDGWPGRFRAATDRTVVEADYDDSWGRVLGPTTQWRCKVCVDGTGELADVVAADLWDVDERGYPRFQEQEGASAVIARTERGLEAILAAAAAGAIVLEPATMAQLRAAQPLQTTRRRFLWARLAGARLAGRRVPSYPGFRLLELSLAAPRQAIRTLRGTARRVRAQRGR